MFRRLSRENVRACSSLIVAGGGDIGELAPNEEVDDLLR